MRDKKVAIYARCSTNKDQKPEVQVMELRRFCEARNWEVSHEIVDSGFSGASSNRPGLKKLMNLARSRKVDVIAVVKLDRLFRSLKNLINTIDEFKELNIDFVSIGDQIDCSTSAGRLLFHLVGAFSQFEKDLASDRTRLGLEHAVRNGKRLGRPPADSGIIEKILQLRGQGYTYWKIQQELNVSKGLVCRTIKRASKSSSKSENIKWPEQTKSPLARVSE